MTNQDQSAIPPVVEASNLMLGYGQKVILRNVHLKIMAGDFWFIVGRNGSGKTTLVKSLLRQLTPMKGNCFLATHSQITLNLGSSLSSISRTILYLRQLKSLLP